MQESSFDVEEQRIRGAKVVLYHSPSCGFSRRALSLLERKCAAPEVVIAAGRPGVRDWLRAVTGRTTLPQVFIGGRSVGGYSDLLTLELAGELEELLSGIGG